jgi:hypothetical protein
VARRFATKSEGEREDEEIERLVRTSPKVKPPRHDRRRERVETDQDPDLKDPDTVESDPDLSKNYKTIGGSEKRDLITVRLKSNPRQVVQVSPDTLRREPGKYEELEHDEETTTTPEVEPKPRAGPKNYEKLHQSLQEMAKADEEFAAVLKDFTNPNADMFQMAKARPEIPVEQFLRGRTPPKGIVTLGDLQQSLLYKPSLAPSSGQPSRKPSPEPPQGPPSGGGGRPQPQGPREPLPPKGSPGRPVSRGERDEAKLQIVRTFPADVAVDLLLIRPPLHPDEVSTLIGDYHKARSLPIKPSNVEGLRSAVSRFYTTNPNQVRPPKTVSRDGRDVPFGELDGEKQAEALRRHQLQTVAMSLAAHRVIGDTLEHKAGAPRELASDLASFMLTGHGEAPEARQKRATHEAEALFYKGLEASPGSVKPVSAGAVKKVLRAVKDPASQRLAVGYFQAHDYNEARRRFLDPRSEDHISERQSPDVIASRIAKAMDFLRARALRYPEGLSQDTGTTFRARVMRHLGTLAPEKLPLVQELLDEEDNRYYDRALKQYKRAQRAYEEAKQHARRAFKRDYQEYSSRLRDGVDDSDPPLSTLDRLAAEGILEPQEPVKPPHYDLRRQHPEELAASSLDLWERFQRRTAARVAVRSLVGSFFTYSDTIAMERNRQAVYWGVEPEVVTHPGWSQPQSRDLGEADLDRILTAARQWLNSPVLSQQVDGIVRDTQLRAALDLAIQANNYRNAIHPKVYNDLLARLAGKSLDETLTTVTAGSPARTVRNEMPKKIELETTMADRLLARLDRVASTVQEQHGKWGMGFEQAKGLVNEIDRIADELEVAAYGENSMTIRQAQVIQRETDEPYMDTFENPQQPHQTDADEPYMDAYRSDDSSGVHQGKAENGRPLAP